MAYSYTPTSWTSGWLLDELAGKSGTYTNGHHWYNSGLTRWNDTDSGVYVYTVFQFEWWSSQDVATNSSRIDWRLYALQAATTYYGGTAQGYRTVELYEIKINNNQVGRKSGDTRISTTDGTHIGTTHGYNYYRISVASSSTGTTYGKSVTLNHNNDGSLSLSFSVTVGVGTTSTTHSMNGSGIELPIIPRYTCVYVNNGTRFVKGRVYVCTEVNGTKKLVPLQPVQKDGTVDLDEPGFSSPGVFVVEEVNDTKVLRKVTLIG